MLKAGIHPKVVSERLGHANIVIMLWNYSYVLPGLQEAAAVKFNRIFEVGEGRNGKKSDADVNKMSANSDGLTSRPYRIRTCDTLIKSQVLYQLS
jgi:integrase